LDEQRSRERRSGLKESRSKGAGYGMEIKEQRRGEEVE
jgi:hypothetical protein